MAAKRKRTRPTRRHRGDGIYEQVTPNGSRSWLLKFTMHGRQQFYGMGSGRTFKITEVKRRAQKIKALIADGVNPVEQRRQEKLERRQVEQLKQAMPFSKATQIYYDNHRAEWSNDKHAAQFLSTLRTYAFPILGEMSVAEIETQHIVSVLEPIWTTKTETASRVRQRIEKVLGWASASGYRSKDTLNPARWKHHLETLLAKPSRVAPVQPHKALPFAELPTFVEQLQARDGFAARALEFTILTVARTSQVTMAQWDEIDLDAKVWTAPAEHMKGIAGKRREHVVPLSARAVEILKALPRVGDFVFPGPNGGLSNAAMDRVLDRMGLKDRATVHGFRSTFRDWAGERSHFDHETIEFAMAHQVPDKAEKAYRRYRALEKRRKLMEAWAKYATTPKPEGKVVTFEKKAEAEAA